MTAPWQRPRFNGAGGPIDELPFRSAPPGAASSAGAPDTTGQGTASLGWTLTRSAPEEAPPPGSSYFSAADTQAIVGAGIVSQFPNAVFVVDGDRYGVLKSLDFEVTDYTKLSAVRFSLLVNGAPLPAFNQILIPPAAAALKTRGFDLSLPLPRGATVSVSVLNVDGGAYTVNVSYFGWQWAVAIDARYRPEGVGIR